MENRLKHYNFNVADGRNTTTLFIINQALEFYKHETQSNKF